jgi:Fe2+ transport system protein FeoA
MSSTTLNALKVGESGRVVRLDGPPGVRRRLLEMGLTPGATVELVRFAPLGDPIDIRVRGYHLSLRKQEASCVTLETE